MPVDPILAPLLPDLPPMPAEIDNFHVYRSEAGEGAAVADQLPEAAPEEPKRQSSDPG